MPELKECHYDDRECWWVPPRSCLECFRFITPKSLLDSIEIRFLKKGVHFQEQFHKYSRKQQIRGVIDYPDKEYLTGELLEEFKKEMDLAIKKTFNAYGRCVSFNYVDPNYRCMNCSKSLIDEPRREKYCSDGCRSLIYYRYDWQFIRAGIFERDKYTCQSCSQIFPLEYLEADHIIEISTGGSILESAHLFFDRKNIQTLCYDCHKKKTASYLSTAFSKITLDVRQRKLSEFLDIDCEFVIGDE